MQETGVSGDGSDWDYRRSENVLFKLLAKEGRLKLHIEMASKAHRFVSTNLISASVEQWYPETIFFHMPWVEMIITLEIVKYLIILNVKGTIVSNMSPSMEKKPRENCLIYGKLSMHRRSGSQQI